MSMRSALMKILADGGFHSGTDIGRALGVTRAAVSKAVGVLVDSGIQIHRVSGRGYRLENAFEPLEHGRILAFLGSDAALISGLWVRDEVDSTSLELLRMPGVSAHGQVCITETQSSGRGRRGRGWIATPYANLMLSVAWCFDEGLSAVAGLSLAAGVAAARALREFGVEQAGLKWPNDLLWNERKLGGLLVDLRGEASGPCMIVAGVGINVRIAEHDGRAIDQPWVDLATILGGIVDRNRLAALLIRQLARMLQRFAHEGLAPFREEWVSCHHYQGRRVRLAGAGPASEGVVQGIDQNGALLVLDDDGNVRAFHSGEVSLRHAGKTETPGTALPDAGAPRP
ncbi:MAG: bifunctional biotin--[acetyl-CoA-carboxylase] ligase/biotin operon repressor BirA [Acidiferrobacterales bacterium]